MTLAEKSMTRRALGLTLSTLLALGAAGCTLQVHNTRPRADQAASPPPVASVYTGWRVFQEKCASCHGIDATGGSGPDLVLRAGEIGPRRFVDLVLRRYDWILPEAQARRDDAAYETLIEAIVQRRRGAFVMPAWQGEPRVEAHILDLYAYLAARAEGTQGPGRPAR
jgi:mono/diheme cytochrome c family protein